VLSQEKSEVRFVNNGQNHEVFIALATGHFAKFTKSPEAPSDWRSAHKCVALGPGAARREGPLHYIAGDRLPQGFL